MEMKKKNIKIEINKIINEINIKNKIAHFLLHIEYFQPSRLTMAGEVPNESS